MRRTLGGGAAVLSAALLACGSRAPSGFTLLFLGRRPGLPRPRHGAAPRRPRPAGPPGGGPPPVPRARRPFPPALGNGGGGGGGPDGSVYYAPLVRDEIRKYAPSGAPRWTARRG